MSVRSWLLQCLTLSVCIVFQLTVVMERIMAFSLASPLAKFLNGLEILLSKAQVCCANKIPPEARSITLASIRVPHCVDKIN